MEEPLIMATKAATTVRHLDLPVGRVRQIVTTEEFLLTVDDADSSTLRITEGSREARDDGSVRAVVTAESTKENSSFVVEQTSEVSVPDDDGKFTVFTTVPMPKNVGSMATNQIYSADGDGTRLETTVAVEVRIPLVGGKIANKVLEGVESSTDQGVKRILDLAEK